ncbi:MAG: GAF domain-containing protein [Motiliproteus sp.]
MSSDPGLNTACGVSDSAGRSPLQRRTHILELLFSDHPLPELLSELVQIIEQECQGMVASILLLSDDKGRLLLGAAPSLPDDYNQTVNGMQIGQGQGSCGTAAYTGKRVIVTDIDTHPYWGDFKQLALGAGLKACWSEPVFDSQGQVLGTFAMYYYQQRVPTA